VNVLIPDDIARKHDRLMDQFVATWAKEGFPPTSKVVNPRAPRDIKAVRHMSDGTKVLFDAEMFVRFVFKWGRNRGKKREEIAEGFEMLVRFVFKWEEIGLK
jgi:propanediol dehydratase large subunit